MSVTKYDKAIGGYLVIDGLVSLLLVAGTGLLGFSVSVGHFFRFIRIILGFLFLTNKIQRNWLKLIGIWLIIDAVVSIINAPLFDSKDDYLRVSRIALGGYLLGI